MKDCYKAKCRNVEVSTFIYRIRPNYCTVPLSFSKLLGQLVVKYVSISTKNTLKKSAQVDAIQMGTYNICLYKKVDKKYTDCNPKTMALLDCAYRSICGN